MMTRKDYVATATILDNFIAETRIADQEICWEMVEAFADMFEADNPNFSRGIFIDACYRHQEDNE